MPERIALEHRDGQWKLPGCECAFHYFDGTPAEDQHWEIVGGIAKHYKSTLTGIVAPHLHLCAKHATERNSAIVTS